MIEPIETQPNASRNNCTRYNLSRSNSASSIPKSRSSSSDRCLPLSSASFSNARCNPRSNAMRIAWPLGSHPCALHAASNNIPVKSIVTDSKEEKKITLDSFLTDDRAKKRRSCNALGLFQTLVECWTQRTIPATDLSRNCEYSVKSPRTPFRQTLVRVIGRVKQRDKQVTSRKETMQEA